jgi:hypothetical protein
LILRTVAIEIRSPGDKRRDVEDNVAVLIRAGTEVVIVVNPKTRTVIAQDASLRRIFWGDETFEHFAVPDFTFALPEMFGALRRRPVVLTATPTSRNAEAIRLVGQEVSRWITRIGFRLLSTYRLLST